MRTCEAAQQAVKISLIRKKLQLDDWIFCQIMLQSEVKALPPTKLLVII